MYFLYPVVEGKVIYGLHSAQIAASNPIEALRIAYGLFEGEAKNLCYQAELIIDLL